jgi:hypothetical protein
MHTTYPASMPVAAPFESQRPPPPSPYPLTPVTPVTPVMPRAMVADVALLPAAPPVTVPVSSPLVSASPAPPPVEVTADPSAAQSWRPSMASVDWSEGEAGEHMVGTLQLRKPSELRRVVGKLVLPILLLVVAGVAIGALVAFRGDVALVAPAAIEPAPEPSNAAAVASPEPAAASSAPAAASPAPAAPSEEQGVPSADSIVEPARPPELVEVRIDSTPSGATVTLVDRGKSQFVGTTPVNAAVDPSREYDLVFSWASRPAQQEHLDPRTTRRVAATLDKRPPASRPADTAPRRERTEPGEGTLMISSKPPCEIVIDGKPTGLTTPQRAIALPAGNHKVTLINRENDVRRTIGVEITQGATEKVIEDLMK